MIKINVRQNNYFKFTTNKKLITNIKNVEDSNVDDNHGTIMPIVHLNDDGNK